MNESMKDSEIYHLNIGEMVISDRPIVISTVLGSCVSVCLFDREKKAGGMIHYALSHAEASVQDQDRLRYGKSAIPLLIKELSEYISAEPRRFSAKIVGGASVLPGVKAEIGLANIKVARAVLQTYGIPIVGEDVGDYHGRKVLFYTESGRLTVGTVAKTA